LNQFPPLSCPLPARKVIFFYFLVCEAIGTAVTPGLLCQSRVIVKMIVEKQMECRLAGETKVLGENLLQRHFRPTTKSHMTRPGLIGVDVIMREIRCSNKDFEALNYLIL
jgi:hypothetical protein